MQISLTGIAVAMCDVLNSFLLDKIYYNEILVEEFVS
jgi:hypothetical protein